MSEKKQTFEESMAELEGIIKQLETGDVPLEKALVEFQRGIILSKECQDTLTRAEATLTKMMSDDGELLPFDAQGE